MKLALGAAQFGLSYGIANQSGQVSRNEGIDLLRLAAENGINTIDTAIAYGESESKLGEIGVEDWLIVSKLPAIPDGCSDVVKWVTESTIESLRRLNVKSLYGFLLHRPQQLVEKNGDNIYRALQQLKQDGLIQKIGISVYDPSELDAICGRFPIDLVQAPFNIIDRRLIDTGWLSRLAERGIELHVRSIFLQGLLLMSMDNRPAKFAQWSHLWSEWHAWLKDENLTPLQACLRYTLSFPEISRVIVGVDNQKQLKEIIDSANGDSLHVPEIFKMDNPELINPALWASLR